MSYFPYFSDFQEVYSQTKAFAKKCNRKRNNLLIISNRFFLTLMESRPNVCAWLDIVVASSAKYFAFSKQDMLLSTDNKVELIKFKVCKPNPASDLNWISI